jgi:hypothetical protein
MLDQSLPTWALGTNNPGDRNAVTTRLAGVFDYDKQHNAPRLPASELFGIVDHLCRLVNRDCGFHVSYKPTPKEKP